jgi:hypothetical protein
MKTKAGSRLFRACLLLPLSLGLLLAALETGKAARWKWRSETVASTPWSSGTVIYSGRGRTRAMAHGSSYTKDPQVRFDPRHPCDAVISGSPADKERGNLLPPLLTGLALCLAWSIVARW